jgi:hypothetical protein
MKPFLFSRGQKHYARFLIPSKFRTFFSGQKFLVFALGAGEGHVVRQKASTIESLIAQNMQQGIPVEFGFDKIRTYELDLNRGIAKADGPEDHARLMDALKLLRGGQTTPTTPEDALARFEGFDGGNSVASAKGARSFV